MFLPLRLIRIPRRTQHPTMLGPKMRNSRLTGRKLVAMLMRTPRQMHRGAERPMGRRMNRIARPMRKASQMEVR